MAVFGHPAHRQCWTPNPPIMCVASRCTPGALDRSQPDGVVARRTVAASRCLRRGRSRRRPARSEPKRRRSRPSAERKSGHPIAVANTHDGIQGINEIESWQQTPAPLHSVTTSGFHSERPTGCMSVAAVTEASDLEQQTIVTNRTASKNQSGDCAATLPTCTVGRQSRQQWASHHAARQERLTVHDQTAF